MNKRINDITNLTFNFMIDYCCCSSSAFHQASQFNSDLSTWDVSSVTNMQSSKFSDLKCSPLFCRYFVLQLCFLFSYLNEQNNQ